MKNNNNKKRTPVQGRGINTKNKLLEAGYKLFVSQGYYPTNSKQIAKEANVAIGSFYAYFDDKKDILIELYYQTVEEIVKTLESLILDNAVIDKKKMSIYNIVKGIMDVDHVRPIFFHELQTLALFDESIKKVYLSIEKKFYAAIRKAFDFWKKDLVIKDFDYAAIIVFKLFEQVIINYIRNPQAYDKEKYFSEVTDLIYRYLFVKE